MLITTRRRNRALLRAFALVSAAVLGAVAAGAARALGSPVWPMWGAATFFGLAAIGWLNLGAARAALDAWDRFSNRVARFARLTLSLTAFAIIALAGRAGSRLPWKPDPRDASGWVARPGGAASAFESQSALPGGDRGWVRNLLGWAARSRNLWVWALIPPLLLLSGIQLSNRRSLGGATYTLY